jgi:hypothetical protein
VDGKISSSEVPAHFPAQNWRAPHSPIAPAGRTTIKGKQRKEKKYVRQQFTYEHRLAAIDHLAATGDMKSTIDRLSKSPDDKL